MHCMATWQGPLSPIFIIQMLPVWVNVQTWFMLQPSVLSGIVHSLTMQWPPLQSRDMHSMFLLQATPLASFALHMLPFGAGLQNC